MKQSGLRALWLLSLAVVWYAAHSIVDSPVRADIAYRNIYYQQWKSAEQFKAWYSAHEWPTIWIVGDKLADCDDYAERLQRTALEEGYPISLALVPAGYYYDVWVDTPNRHMGNLIMIQNEIFYVEPIPDKFKIIKVTNRD